MPEQVVAYRQDDARWADDKLGNSAFTMRPSGCPVSYIASAVSMETELPARILITAIFAPRFAVYHFA